MKVVAGLGNPGAQYAHTPHNIGFQAVEVLAEKLEAPWKDSQRFKARIAKAMVQGQPVWLLEPQTYMNLSGECLGPFLKYYGGTAADVLVLSDDCDLPVGKLRLRPSGSAGGHNGLGNIILHLGTEQFARLRIGVGRATGKKVLKDYVLGACPPEVAETLKLSTQIAAEATCCWLTTGINEAMNRFNAWQAPSLLDEAK